MTNKRENDAFFIDLVKSGKFSVSESGEIKNLSTGRVVSKDKATFSTSSKGKPVNIGTGRFIWIIYKGPVPDGFLIYRKELNKGYYLDNLEMKSIIEHNNEAISKSKTRRKGARNKNSVFTDEQVIALRKEYAEKPFSLRDRAKELGTNHPTLSMALKGISYSYLPDPVTITNTLRGPKKGTSRKGISMANRKPRMHVVEPLPTPHVISNKSVPAKPLLPLDTPKPQPVKVPTTVKNFTKEELQLQNTPLPKPEPSTLPTVDTTYKPKPFTAEDKKKRLELIRERSARMKRY